MTEQVCTHLTEDERAYLQYRNGMSYRHLMNPIPYPKRARTWHANLMLMRRIRYNLGFSLDEAKELVPNNSWKRFLWMFGYGF